MRNRYDFSKMKGRKNPFVKHLKLSVTMRTSAVGRFALL